MSNNCTDLNLQALKRRGAVDFARIDNIIQLLLYECSSFVDRLKHTQERFVIPIVIGFKKKRRMYLRKVCGPEPLFID